MKRSLVGLSLLCVGAGMLFSACSSKKSTGVSDKTGWDYGDSRLGGFEAADYPGQQTGPGLVFVEGGRFTMGQTEEDLTWEQNNIPRTISVSSFYMDETEVSNLNYREYTYWMQRTYGSDYPDVIAKAMPDTTVWRQALSYNEPRVQYYFRHAAYNHYPVVGVNWFQANEYAKWRSDRVNEYILIKNGILKKNPYQVNEDIYTTETYLNEQYDGLAGRLKKDYNPIGSGKRKPTYSDGMFLPEYRLPTEAEWEYAALGLIANNPEPENKRRRGEEVITDRNIYPWNSNHSTRWALRNENQGEFMANFKRGGGDAMGIAGALNDNADYTAPVYSYRPNAYGLYNMAGNVSEWTMDTYRPVTAGMGDLNPYRGNYFETYKRVEGGDNELEDKDSLGHLSTRPLTSEEMANPFHWRKASPDQRDFMDGDSVSQVSYDYGRSSLLNNESKVIKGASWADRAYYMSPGTRRFVPADQSSATIGFRCVMDRLGSPNGDNSSQAGHNYGKSKKGK